MKYAGFWRRLIALLVDFLVFLPFLALSLSFLRSKPMTIILTIPGIFLSAAYHIHCHWQMGENCGEDGCKN